MALLAPTAASGGVPGRLIEGGLHVHAADQFGIGRQVSADGLAGVLAISQDAQRALGYPAGHDLNHLRGQFGTGAILLGGGLAGLLALQLSRFAGRALRRLALAVHANQDGESPVLVGCERQAHLQREDHEVMAEGEEGTFRRGAQGIMVHAGAPDVAPGFPGQGVVDGGEQNLVTKR